MKRCLLLAMLVPFFSQAQPLNTTNNPNLPGYQIPSQQRMQAQMLNQQSQQQRMLKQQMQSQTRLQQQHLQTQLDNNAQRVKQAQPGTPQPLSNAGSSMLPEKHNGDMLKKPQTAPLTP